MKSILNKFTSKYIISDAGEIAFVGDILRFADNSRTYELLDYRYGQILVQPNTGPRVYYNYDKLGFRKDWTVKR